jgi:basic membrane lipoprotein Med (substrate-binding protein (PBP1-ABC) superfamily)
VSDAGWNAAAFQGLQQIKKDLNVETALVQTQSPSDFEDSLPDFASRGFSIVFTHGFEYTDAALRVGKLFPKTRFIVTSLKRTRSKCASLTFKIEEATYVQAGDAGLHGMRVKRAQRFLATGGGSSSELSPRARLSRHSARA